MVVASLGSNATRATNRPGRLRVILVSVNAPSALVDTRTRPPTATTTLLLLVAATSTSFAVPGIATFLGHVAPLSVLCQRFALLPAYTVPSVLGSTATAENKTFDSAW